MLQLCTLNVGDYQGRGVEYTNILFDMVRRNLPAGFEGIFTVFVDYPYSTVGYHPDIRVRGVPEPDLEGWWHKLSLFKDGLFPHEDRIVYVDLSTVITGRLDDIVKYAGPFAILRDFYRPDGLQSAFMAWKANAHHHIWRDWKAAGMPKTDGGDQAWIEAAMRGQEMDAWQDMFPGKFVSYKLHPEIPLVASVVKFHGEPKPHEITVGWVPEVWKIDGMTRAELDNVCNTEMAKLNENIVANSKLPLPWFELRYGDYGNAAIVGGGPSLAATLDKLRWRKEQGHPIFATNATHDYLIEHGIVPEYHVMVDARPENADFVRRPHPRVHYLIGSQCDPSVLAALEGCQVTLFHNMSPGAREVLKDETRPVQLVGGGTTVGMKAMLLAELMGFRNLHLFGMDSCYSHGEHHAYVQTMNDDENVIDLLYGDQRFKVAPWMASQANDFIEYCSRFTGIVTVAGDGLLAYIARCGIDETPADTRAREVLQRLPDGAMGVEVGVFGGDMSGRLLADPKIDMLYMVDSWSTSHSKEYIESGDFHTTLSQEQQESCMDLAKLNTSFAARRREIVRANSVEAAAQFPDHLLDFVFLDADHSYEGCMADIKAWAPKIRPGGLLCGHDYQNVDYPCFGVERAVDEYVATHGLTLELGDNYCWFTQLLEDENARIRPEQSRLHGGEEPGRLAVGGVLLA
jgi:hypothetical protein